MSEGTTGQGTQPIGASIDASTDRRNRYTYHSPSEKGVETHARLSELFINLEAELALLVPPGREFSLVKTNLEQAKMWASAGVARNPDTR